MMTTLAALSFSWKTMLPVGLLTAALAIGTLLAQRVWNDLKGESPESSSDPADLLGPLADAFSAGQMSEEEYQKIRTSVARGLSTEKPAPLPVRPVGKTPGPSPSPSPSPGVVEESPPAAPGGD